MSMTKLSFPFLIFIAAGFSSLKLAFGGDISYTVPKSARGTSVDFDGNVLSTTSFSFLVMGDWGGQGSSPYTTKQEVATAAGMGKVAEAKHASFALALGDNFYTFGVDSVNSSRFKTTFEDVFSADSLSSANGFRFHVLAGNHDHYGNVDAQVAYSSVSQRWVFPSLYYTFTVGSVQFVMIDTVLLSGVTHDEISAPLPGPPSKVAADAQLKWIEETLKESTSPYLIVAGHYPVHSICEHGPTAELINDVAPLLEKYKATAWMNGHDHCAEHIDVGDGVQFHTVGSAHVNDPSTAHASTIKPDQLKFHVGTKANGGFASVDVTDQGLTIVHHDGDGNILYTAPAIPPRTAYY